MKFDVDINNNRCIEVKVKVKVKSKVCSRLVFNEYLITITAVC